MKKIFNYALLAAALLVGVNVNAEKPNFSIKQGDNEETASTLKEAVEAVTTDGGPATITVNNHYTMACTNHVGEVITIDGGKDIILDLNGNEIIMESSNWSSNFKINNGKLRLASLKENSVGTLELYGVYSDKNGAPEYEDYADSIPNETYNYYGIQLIGSNEQLAPGTEYSKLKIDENVNYTHKHNGYAIQVKPTSDNYAEGVVIEIEGTVKGGWSALTINGNTKKTYGAGENKVYVHVAPTGSLIGSDLTVHSVAANEIAEIKKYYMSIGIEDSEAERIAKRDYVTGQAGIYGAGLGKYLVEGKVEGGIGIYAKAGNLELRNATVKATGDKYWRPICFGNGWLGNGSAIVFDSNGGYATDMSVVINGKTTVEAVTGYAIEELVTSGTEHMSGEDFVINSGTFKGGSEGCLSVTAELGEDVKVQGTITGGTYNENIVDLLSNVNGIITPIDNGDGTTSYVVSTKEPTQVWTYDITTAVAGDYVEISGTYDKSLTKDVEAAYLVAKDTAKVTIPTGKTLTVGEIVLDKNAQIVVEKGAYLIVEGYKGIVANQASNIVLKSEEGAPAYFLLDPQVTSNKTPKATVNFTSNSWYEDATHYQYQYFGAPMVGGAIENITPINFASWTDFYVWNKTAWVDGGYVKGAEDHINYSAFQNPFGFYAMVANTPYGMTTEYEMTGRLFGNTNPEVPVIKGYVPMSNGFTANMDGDLLIQQLETTTIEKAAWAPKSNADGSLQWQAYTELRKLEEVKPMGTFMVKNDGSATTLNLDYKTLVWNHTTGTGTKAPKVNNFAMATVRVDGCDLNDIVTVAEDNNFSADFDNGFDAEKYENTNIRFYVNAEKEYDIFATDNLDNTFVGLMTTKAGKYTISFEDVTGNFALIDNKTNARIAMAEGNTYEFMAEAGEDAYRFTIVAGAQAPTEMQKTNAAVKATRALINGQIVISNGERFFNVLGAEVK